MIFETSGSTGRPKRIEHVSALLRREAAFFLQLLGKPERVVRFVPPQHLFGYIFGVLMPEMAGVRIFDARTYYGGYRPVQFVAGDFVVAAPHQWQWLADHPRGVPAQLRGVTSTAACPPDLFARFELLDVYGSTETSGVGYRTEKGAPYELLPWWDASDLALSQNDYLEWVGPRQFVLLGRKDAAVQVSGINIYPAMIERRLLEHDGIAAASVRLMRPDEGRRLKAFLVLKPGVDQTAVEAWIRKNFEGPEEIARLSYGESLPRDGGKAADW